MEINNLNRNEEKNMDKKGIISEFITNEIKNIDCELIRYLDTCYQDGEKFDEEVIRDFIYQKRLLERYL